MENIRAISLMILAMAGFALGDVGIKLMSRTVPLGQTVLMMAVGGTLIFAIWTRLSGRKILVRALAHPAVIMRWGAEMAAAISMPLALMLTPLSLVTSIQQAGPIVVTMAAALIFGETVGWRRWSAILVGLCGVLLVLRPGTAGFDSNAWYAVIAMLGLAARDLATRAVPRSLSTLQLATFGLAAMIPSGLVLHVWLGGLVLPNAAEWALSLMTIIATVLGYYAITAAMRIGEISAVIPFRYSRLVFGIVLGILVFSESPDIWVYLGGAMVVGSGIYMVWRERRLRHSAA